MENKPQNITYLLGAGASANALPTISSSDSDKNQMADRINAVSQKVRVELLSDNRLEQHKEYLEKLIKDIQWLSTKTREYGTPDTYAKFLYITNDPQLVKLKNILSAYFVLEQFIYNQRDKRALVFLISILQKTAFPKTVKILSWNYDFQMQLAAENFKKESFNTDKRVSRKSMPLMDYHPMVGSTMPDKADDIALVHLNGIAGAFHSSAFGYEFCRNVNESAPSKSNDEIISILKSDDFNRNLLWFAWEQSKMSEKGIEYALDIARETDILVIVGYSFPFFNRDIDKQIFDELKRTNKPIKIYYQEPNKDIDVNFLKNQFNLNDHFTIKHITTKNTYFLPHEL